MRIQEHLKLSSVASLVALPWLKRDIWIPFTSSILIDVDHYLWYAATHRSLSLREAVRYFRQAQPTRRPEAKLFHHPIILGTLALLASVTRWRVLWLILAGMLFHVSLDAIHNTEFARIQQTLVHNAQGRCPECGQQSDALELHTARVSKNFFTVYSSGNYIPLCHTCHERAHQGV